MNTKYGSYTFPQPGSQDDYFLTIIAQVRKVMQDSGAPKKCIQPMVDSAFYSDSVEEMKQVLSQYVDCSGYFSKEVGPDAK